MRSNGMVLLLSLGLTSTRWYESACFSTTTTPSPIREDRPFHVAYDLAAPLVTPEAAHTLNAVLAQHGTARLLPGDYSAAGNVTLRSGYKLYGLLPSNNQYSRLTQIDVETGTTDALVASLALQMLIFRGGPVDSPTHHNEFRSLYGPSIVFESDAHLEDNLFIDNIELGCGGDCPACTVNMTTVGHFVCPNTFEGGCFSGDFRTGGGWLRNNRFIRLVDQAPYPMVAINGTRETSGNTWLWVNALGGIAQALFQVRGLADLTQIGSDIEIYGGGTKRSLYFARDIDSVRVANAHGGLSFGGLDGGQNEGMYDIDAKEFMMMNIVTDHCTGPSRTPCENTAPWDVRLGPSNRDFLRLEVAETAETPRNSRLQDDSSAVSTMRADYSASNFSFTVDSATAKARLRSFVVQKPGVQWPKPRLAPVPDPLGPNWRWRINGTTVDSTEFLQTRIDQACNSTPAMIGAGVYFISAPLRIGCAGDDECCGIGLVGESASSTVIVAITEIDMVKPKVNCNSSTKIQAYHFTLMQLTLQGGARGIHQENCFGYQVNGAQLSAVTLRDMAKGGVVFTNLYAWDNNMVSHVNFANINGPAWHQQPAGAARIDGDCNYMDKVVFYRCQIINVSVGFNLTVGRQDDTNMWLEVAFENVSQAAVCMNGNSLPMFVNCDFAQVGGSPAALVWPDTVMYPGRVGGTLNSSSHTGSGNGFTYQPSFIGCRFSSGPHTTAFLSPGVIIEGCSFVVGQGGDAATLFPAGSKPTGVVIAGSLVSVALGADPTSALLLNTRFNHSADATYNVMATSVSNGSSIVLLDGEPSGLSRLPNSQLLWTAPTTRHHMNRATHLTNVTRQLRWYLEDPRKVEDFLLGNNSRHHIYNSSSLGDITGGIYQCCTLFSVHPNGSLITPHRANQTIFSSAWASAGIDSFATIAVAPRNCTPAGNDKKPGETCITTGQICNAALGRGSAFVSEVIEATEAFGLRGVHLDEEYGFGNNLTCHIKLWGRVRKALNLKGKQLAISIDDSSGTPAHPSLHDTSWSFLNDWPLQIKMSDIMINMGTYPLGNHPQSYPATKKLKPYPCPGNRKATCGLEGQVLDLIQAGVDPSFQLQLGLQLDGCSADGTTTHKGGWTSAVLEEFLSFAGEKGINILTLWLDSGMSNPSAKPPPSVCPWVFPTLRRWVEAGREPRDSLGS